MDLIFLYFEFKDREGDVVRYFLFEFYCLYIRVVYLWIIE